MDTIFKTLSAREHKTYARLKARVDRAEQSAALPAKPLPKGKPAPRRAHRVQHRHESRDGEAAPDSELFSVLRRGRRAPDRRQPGDTLPFNFDRRTPHHKNSETAARPPRGTLRPPRR